jgi:hypothetical protein
MSLTSEMVWHNDGHVIHLKINKSELEVVEVFCPNEDVGECKNEWYGCVVKWFIDSFGMECNVGSCPALPEMEICWTMSGDGREIETGQLWFMPLADEVFNAWFISRVQP